MILASWEEFRQKVNESRGLTDSWTVKEGEALYTDGEDLVATVRLKVPEDVINPAGYRAVTARNNEDEVFEVEASDDSGADAYTRFVCDVWIPLWGDGVPTLKQINPLPEGYRKPESLDFTEFQLKDFVHARDISKTPLAPLWGQHKDYFWEPVAEFNAAPLQEHDGEITRIFRQGWLERLPPCPFCNIHPVESVVVYALRPPEQEVYSKDFYVMVCPRCERAMDVLRVEVTSSLLGS